MTATRLLPLLLLLPLAAGAQEPIVLDPPVPRPGELFEIHGSFSTSCPLLRSETRVSGRVIHLTSVQGCACLPGLPAPFTISGFAGPLAAGPYTVKLEVANEQDGTLCFPPVTVVEKEISVSPDGGPGLLAVAPFPPSADRPVRFTLRTLCPLQTRYDPPVVDGRTITFFRRLNSAILGPCVEQPEEVASFELPPLAPGTYTLRQLTVDVPLVGEGKVRDEPDFEVPLEVTDAALLSLGNGRFTVEARWKDGTGASGLGHPVSLTTDSGYFWFFSPTNVELVVKVLDGCPVNQYFWVFAAGLTNVEVDLTVKDNPSGESHTFHNPLGAPFGPILATAVFDACAPSP